jgi:hypothetical protein
MSEKHLTQEQLQKLFPNPDTIGQMEYRLIHDLLQDIEQGDMEPDEYTQLCLSSLGEFRDWANALTQKIKAEMYEPPILLEAQLDTYLGRDDLEWDSSQQATVGVEVGAREAVRVLLGSADPKDDVPDLRIEKQPGWWSIIVVPDLGDPVCEIRIPDDPLREDPVVIEAARQFGGPGVEFKRS